MDEFSWMLPQRDGMRVPAIIFASEKLIAEMDNMLTTGAQWAIIRGFGPADDLRRTESNGMIPDAEPDRISNEARRRQRDEMGTLGSGNHYLEVQEVAEIYEEQIAEKFGTWPGVSGRHARRGQLRPGQPADLGAPGPRSFCKSFRQG